MPFNLFSIDHVSQLLVFLFLFFFPFLTILKMEKRCELHIQIDSDKTFISYISQHYLIDR